MSFKIGQKVVCVDDSNTTGLVRGEIYTYLGLGHICEGDHLIVIDDGLTYPGHCPSCGFIYSGYTHRLPHRFRPIVDIGDEVEEYILSKINQPVEV